MQNIRSITRINKAYLFYSLVCASLVMGMQPVLLGQVSPSVYFFRSDLRFTTVTTEDGNIYEKVFITDLQQTDELSKPSLPVKYVKLIVPYDKDVEKVIIKKTNKQEIPGTYLILPVQPPIPTSLGFQKPDFVQPDSSVYNSDEPYPSEIVRFVHNGYFDGYNHIVTLAIYPLQYKPKSGRLVFFSSIDFELKMKQGKIPGIPGGIRSKKNQGIYNAILEKIVDNPEDIILYRTQPVLGKAMRIQTNPLPSYEYVLITTNALKDEFEAFISWKMRKGLDIGIVTMEQITANYSGDDSSGITDEAGAVRQYLADSYNSGSPKTMWALLAGDHTIVPVRYGDGYKNSGWEDYSYYKIPVNLYFADFNGDWDVDGDIRYGEKNTGESDDDDPDYNPEIFVGRLPCTNVQDIEKWIEKALEYELDPGNGDYSYLKKAFWVSADQMIDEPDLVSPKYPSCMTHTKWKGTNPGNLVVEEMSNKYGILNWYCHGDVNAFSTNRYTPSSRFVWTTDDGKFWNDDDQLVQSGVAGDGLDNMTNDNYPSVVYSICCDVCAYDDFRSTDNPGTIPGNCYPTDQRSMAEGFNCTNWYINGPIILGNTRNGFVGVSCALHQEFSDLWRTGFVDIESGQSSFHAGVAESVSKQRYDDHYLLYSHNCFGCPETEIWTDTPSEFTDVSVTDNGSSITVNTHGVTSTICACSGDNGVNYHWVVDNVSSYTFLTPVRPLYVTITKHNYIPYTAVTGGTFTSNEYWFENLHVLASVEFKDNSQLTILPGTEVILHGHYNISVRHDSKILAQGTEDEHITFKRAGGTNWNYLYINGSYNRLEWCDFEDGASVMLRAYKPDSSAYKATDNIVQNCTFENMSQWALYAKMNNNVTVSNCVMYDNHHAVFCELNNDVDFSGNHIHDSEKDGIYSTSGNFLDFEWNVIENSGIVYSNRSGIYTSSSDVIDLGDYHRKIPIRGYNTIRNNNSNGIYAGYGNPSVHIYYCSIHNNDSYELKNYNGNPTIETWHTWWGTSPHFLGSKELNDPIYAIPPWDGSTSGGTGKVIAQGMNNIEGDSYRDDRERIEQLKEIIANQPNTTEANEALIELYALLRMDYHEDKLNEKDGFYSYLDEIYQKHRNKKLGKLAQEKKIFWKSLEGDFSTAIEISKKAMEEFTGEERMCVLGNLVTYYLQTDQLKEAKECLNEYKEKYAFNENGILCMEEEIALYEWEVAEGFRENRDKNLPEQMSTSGIATLDLFQNYPNPGNPTTTIRFQLPVADHVTLKIYNILGKEVRNLVDGRREAGDYTVIWDGKNNRGMEMPSGVYLYTLHVGEKVFTRKLTLLR